MAVNEKLQAEVAITAKVDQKSFKQAEKLVEKLTGKKTILFSANMTTFNQKVNEAIKKLNKISDKKVSVDVNTGQSNQKLNNIVDKLKSIGNKNVNINVNTGDSNQKVEKLKSNVEKVEGKKNLIVTLIDNATAGLNKIKTYLTQVKDKGIKVSLQDAASSGLTKIKNLLTQIGNKTVKPKIDNSGIEKTGHSLRGIWYQLIEIGAVAGAAKGIQTLSDSYNSLVNKLSTVTQSRQDAEELFKTLKTSANNARVPVEEYITTFQRLQLVNKELGGSMEETAKMVDVLSKGLIASGATTSEAASVMLQFSQAFGAGRLQGDEFRSLSENMPIILDILAEKLGVARGELKEMAKQGQITSEVMRDALLSNGAERIQEMFDKTTSTIGQALTKLKNNILELFGELDRANGWTKNIVKGINAVTEAFEGLGKNEGFMKLAGFIAVAAGIVTSLFGIIKAVGLLKLAFATLAGTLSLPVVLIAGLASSLIVFRDELAPVVARINEFKTAVLEVAEIVWTSLKEAFDEMKGPLTDIGNKLMEIATTLSHNLQPVFDALGFTIKDVVVAAFNFLINAAKGAVVVLDVLVGLIRDYGVPAFTAIVEKIAWFADWLGIIDYQTAKLNQTYAENREALAKEARQTEEVIELAKESAAAREELNKITSTYTDKIQELKAKEDALKNALKEGTITLEQYEAEMKANQAQVQALETAEGDLKTAIELVENEQISYMDKIHKMNELKLNKNEFIALINTLRATRAEAIATAKAVAQALRTKYEAAKMEAELTNIKDYGSAGDTGGGSLATTKSPQLQFNAIAARDEWQQAEAELKKLEKELEDFNKEVEETIKYKDEIGAWATEFKQDTGGSDGSPKDDKGNTSKSGGGGGSSKASEDAEKKAQEEAIKAIKKRAEEEIKAINQTILTEEEKRYEIKKIRERAEDEIKKIQLEGYDLEIYLAEESGKATEKTEEEKQKAYKKTYEVLNEGWNEVKDVFEDAIDKQKDKIEDLEDKIKDAKKTIEKLRDDIKKLDEDIEELGKGKEDKLKDRFNKVKEEIEKKTKDVSEIMEKFQKAQQYGLIRQENGEWLPNKDLSGNNGESALKQYAKLPNLQKELNELLKEEKQLREALTDDQIEEAEALAKMTETEKILKEYQEAVAKKEAEKAKKEEEIKTKENEIQLLRDSIAEQEAIIKDFEDKKLAMEEYFKGEKLRIEAEITDGVEKEARLREEALERVNKKALETIENIRLAHSAVVGGPDGSGGGSTGGGGTVNQVTIQEANFYIEGDADAQSIVDELNNYNKGIQ